MSFPKFLDSLENKKERPFSLSLVIRLGLALGSKGDAFVAKRRKNPWVRGQSGETKKEV